MRSRALSVCVRSVRRARSALFALHMNENTDVRKPPQSAVELSLAPEARGTAHMCHSIRFPQLLAETWTPAAPASARLRRGPIVSITHLHKLHYRIGPDELIRSPSAVTL